MKREQITRYIRPEDVPLLDQAILEPIVSSVAREMSESHPDHTVDEWIRILQRALLRGDVLIVIDDTNKRLGLVPSDEPPFSGLVSDKSHPNIGSASPLDLEKWEKKWQQDME